MACRIFVGLAGQLLAIPLAAAQPTIADLGLLPGTTYTSAEALSADGGTVVGASGGGNAFRWTVSGGLEDLGTLAGDVYSAAFGVNRDGSLITGLSRSGAGRITAFRWSRSGGMVSIGALAAWPESIGTAVSADGGTIVGYCLRNTDPPALLRAFAWTPRDGMRDLGTILGGNYSNASGVSGNGSFIVGWGGAPPNDYAHVIRWSANGTVQDLGFSACGEGAQGWAISGDGSTVVGDSLCPEATVAFRWTQAGGMEHIGPLPGRTESHALGTNQDGSFVVGYAFNVGPEPDTTATLWSPALGIINLPEYLAARGTDLSGWNLQTARAISADGLVMIGSGEMNGAQSAWRLQLPCPFVYGPGSSQVVCPLSSARFAVTVAGPRPIMYQWRRNGEPLSEGGGILGSRSEILSIAGVTSSEAGLYDCVVSSACGVAVSDAAALTVCYGDFNCDGGIDGGDVGAFFGAWESGGGSADVNSDGGIDGADVEAFFVLWEAGGCG